MNAKVMTTASLLRIIDSVKKQNKTIRPDVLVKGADWEEKDIVGADLVKAGGGTIERITLVPDISTTVIIEKIVRVFG